MAENFIKAAFFKIKNELEQCNNFVVGYNFIGFNLLSQILLKYPILMKSNSHIISVEAQYIGIGYDLTLGSPG